MEAAPPVIEVKAQKLHIYWGKYLPNVACAGQSCGSRHLHIVRLLGLALAVAKLLQNTPATCLRRGILLQMAHGPDTPYLFLAISPIFPDPEQTLQPPGPFQTSLSL
jgi:hypothetical protein